MSRVLKLQLCSDWNATAKPGMEITHFFCLNFMQPFKQWRNKSEETSFQGKRREQDRANLEETVSVSFKPSLPSSTSVSPRACKLLFKRQLSHLKSCFISSVGICLIRFTGWCLPEWQPWVWVADVCSIKHVLLPELISFLLCFIYLGWHYGTQLVLILEMFSGLEISV